MQTQTQAGSLELIAKPPDMKNGDRTTNQPQDKKQEGMEQDIPTVLTAEMECEEVEHQSLHEPFQLLYSCETFGFPIYASAKVMQSPPLRTRAEIFNQSRIPLLLGSENLTSMGGVFDDENYTLTVVNKDKELGSPTNLEN